MKKTIFLFFIAIFVSSSFLNAQSIKYLSPVPNSKLNNEKTNIIIGYSSPVSLNNINISVVGNISGAHQGTIKLVEDQTKILFIPYSHFSANEAVTVTITSNKGNDNFTFYVRNYNISNPINISDRLSKETGTILNNIPVPKYNNKIFLDTLLQVSSHIYSETSPGNIFLLNFSNLHQPSSFLMILNNDGTPKFYKELDKRGFDFKKQNNYYVYWDEQYYHYKALDSNFNVVDSFMCGNGYITDFHECILEPDNSAWLMSYDPEIVDMSQIVPGGNTIAYVTGLIIQKIDPQKNVVFQWRSWDHFQITDATHENLTGDKIDYVHGNSIGIDKDKNILISSRHLDEITKINYQTGNIMFRLGGKNNQFQFINDTAKFSHQHSIHRLENNNILLYDNGNFHTPKYSRAVEYSLDEINYKAALVWEYRNTPDIYAMAMGNVQRLPNGNTVIGWGSSATTMSEVDMDKNLLMSMSLPPGLLSYRAFRYEISDSILQNPEVPEKFELSQNYPNPFNPITTIKYTLPSESYVTLKVYDILGNEISNLVNTRQIPGVYNVRFNASSLSSGIYFYKLSTEKFTESKKMILIK